jgi:hypothetical protein
MSEVKHAWYSARQGRLMGIVLYKNAQGETVEATIVSRTMDHGCKWDDMVYLGEVVEYVGRKTDGEMKDLKDFTPENIEKLEKIIEREKKLDSDPKRWN